MTAPAIILVKPQLGENIGMAARAMLNFGLEDLRLVAPRDGWPNPGAIPAAAGAEAVLENARVFKTTPEAIADLTKVFAATARERGMMKPALSAREAASEIKKTQGQAGIMFGREAAGLSNEDVVLADAILSVPVNPDFSSLNLAVAVGIVAYECSQGVGDIPPDDDGGGPATKGDMQALYDHIEGALDKNGYFYPEERRGAMVEALRNLLQSRAFNRQQVQTLRGVIKALSQNMKK